MRSYKEQATSVQESETTQLVNAGDLIDSVSAENFRLAFRNHAAGVAVITADDGDGPVAMTATSVFSVSATPPLLVFSVSAFSSATPTILRAGSLVVHLLDVTNVDLARLCSTSGVDRFEDATRWDRLTTGEPYYREAPVHIRGEVVGQYQAGTSTLVVVHVTQVQIRSDELDSLEAPLIYHNRTWLALDRSAAFD